jgi:hypothetical protein
MSTPTSRASRRHATPPATPAFSVLDGRSATGGSGDMEGSDPDPERMAVRPGRRAPQERQYLGDVEDACATADVDLIALGEDFSSSDLAPSLAYVVPDFCHDGRDLHCPFAPGTTGLGRADAFLRFVVPAITSSAAFADDGLLVILFDGGNLPVRENGAKPPPVGAVVLGSFVEKGSVSSRAYDHLSLLRTLAATFGVPAPGRSGRAGVRALGADVFPSTR